jgi:hypothetical protein
MVWLQGLTLAVIGWIIGALTGFVAFVARVKVLERDVSDLIKRMDRAGGNMSDLADHVQKLGDRLTALETAEKLNTQRWHQRP